MKGGGKEGLGPRRRGGRAKDGGAKGDAAAGAAQTGDQGGDIEAWAAIEDVEGEETP